MLKLLFQFLQQRRVIHQICLSVFSLYKFISKFYKKYLAVTIPLQVKKIQIRTLAEILINAERTSPPSISRKVS